jgi:predicted RNA methylase
MASDAATIWAEKVSDALDAVDVPRPLALAALAHPELNASAQRQAGAYYTDFRLATHLASWFDVQQVLGGRAVDLACGSGILLAALTLHVANGDTQVATQFIAEGIVAADLHQEALDATRMTLASLTRDLGAVQALHGRLLVGDSLARRLQQWEQSAPGGFRTVIMNPPWEKLRVTRHEVLTGAGVERDYGTEYEQIDPDAYDAARERMLRYVEALSAERRLQGKGEADLYKLFLELAASVLAPGGQFGLLLPAGLIRSQGTEDLRTFLVDHSGGLDFTVLENRACFFGIDTRFKFLSVHGTLVPGQPGRTLTLRHGSGTSTGVAMNAAVTLDRLRLRELRPDVTVPEVRGTAEWRIFEQMSTRGATLKSPEWQHVYLRELDMTNDRPDFLTVGRPGALPVIEGRLVHQHRVRAKAYRDGSGRSAIWEPLPLGSAPLVPQFWYPRRKLAAAKRAAVDTARAGFCDVTGQTNERTLLAAVIPPGVVCGNKAPTLRFAGRGDPEQTALLWVALANTFAVDWAARRVVTTSMNYFLLKTLPLPVLTDAERARATAVAQQLRAAEADDRVDLWEVGRLRAELDAVAAHRFGLSLNDMTMVMRDFRLLDRGQPPLPGEPASTVTRDLVLATFARLLREDGRQWRVRSSRAKDVGAVPYVPAEYVGTR